MPCVGRTSYASAIALYFYVITVFSTSSEPSVYAVITPKTLKLSVCMQYYLSSFVKAVITIFYNIFVFF